MREREALVVALPLYKGSKEMLGFYLFCKLPQQTYRILSIKSERYSILSLTPPKKKKRRMEEQLNSLAVTHLLQHTLRSLCIHENSQWVYAVFWRILPRNYPPPKSVLLTYILSIYSICMYVYLFDGCLWQVGWARRGVWQVKRCEEELVSLRLLIIVVHIVVSSIDVYLVESGYWFGKMGFAILQLLLVRWRNVGCSLTSSSKCHMKSTIMVKGMHVCM